MKQNTFYYYRTGYFLFHSFAHVISTFRVVSCGFAIVFWLQLHPVSLASVLHESEARPAGPSSPGSLVSERADKVFGPRGRVRERGQSAKETSQLFFLKMRNSKNSVCLVQPKRNEIILF